MKRRVRRLVWDDTWLLALVAGGHVLLFAWFFPRIWTMRFSGIGLFFDYGTRIVRGALPYRDFPAEYPPLAMALFAAPQLVASGLASYFTVFVGILLVADLLALGLIATESRRAGSPPARALGAYTLALVAIGPIAIHQYDLVPAVVTVGALACAARGRATAAGALLAAGVLLKLWPLLAAPVLLLGYLRDRDWRSVWRAAAGGAVVAFAVLLPWLVGGAGSLARMVGYHTGRGLQVESSFASVLLALGALRRAPPPLAFGAGAWNLAGPAADRLAALSGLAMMGLVAAALAWAWRRLPPGRPGAPWFARSALLVLLAALLASKVLSPQYLLWLLPFVALAAATAPPRRGLGILLLFMVIGALTHYVFPSHYAQLLRGAIPATLALLLRNVLLALLAALVAAGPWPGEGAPIRHQESRPWPAPTP